MIVANDLTKDYGEVRAVDGVSLEIEKGECVGLLGLNGAGKTTLLRIMSCLLTPSAGSLTVDDSDVTLSPEKVRGLIGFLPEEPPLYPEMKVGKFLDFTARLRGIPRTDVGGRVQEAARRCRLDKVIDQRIETLSYGYKKRVGIAQAIVHNPPLVILDEPIAGLDPAQIAQMREMVRGLSGQHTVVLSSHILTEISQTCDRIFVMQRGAIIGSGTEEELSATGQQEIRVAVTVRGEKERAEKIIGGVAGVNSCKATHGGEGDLAFEVLCEEDVRPAMSRALVEGGLELTGISRIRDQLESVFLKLTRDGDKGSRS